jgi:hypothetical protein
MGRVVVFRLRLSVSFDLCCIVRTRVGDLVSEEGAWKEGIRAFGILDSAYI